MKAQLASGVSQYQTYLDSPAWAMQQKVDGWRMLLECGPELKTYNRKGEDLDCPQEIRDAFSGLTTEWLFDGELLDGKYYIFDIIRIPTGSVKSWPLSKRYEMLSKLASKLGAVATVLPMFVSTEDKTEAFEKLRDSNAEGVVFKRLDGEYMEKKSTNFLKYKFVNQVDCVVLDTGINDKDNLLLGMYDGKSIVEVGKCSALTGDGPLVKVGDIVQVNALYSTEGGRLYQPVKPKLRTDKTALECELSQLLEIKANKEVQLI